MKNIRKFKNIIFVFTILCAVILSTTVLFASNITINMPKPTQQITRYESVYINKGDTLSNICEEHNTSSLSTYEFTKYVKIFNNMKSDTIYYGDKILIPIFNNWYIKCI